MGFKEKQQSLESKARQADIKNGIMSKDIRDAESAEVEALSEVEPEFPLEVGPKLTETPKEANPKVEPKRKGRPAVNRETKKRYSVTVLPSLYDAATQKAYEQGKSLSEVIGDFLSEYIKVK